MKSLFSIILLSLSSTFFSQDHSLYVKANALTLPVAVLNAGFEYQLSSKYTLEADGFISPWKSFAGKHAQIYMAHLEGRYYFKEAFKHWYVGLNGGFGVFDITKYNYFNTNKYQRGFNFMFGAVAGYQFQWRKNWNVDVFLRGGSSQGFYHGYALEGDPPSLFRYEKHSGKWNKSGEWIPYGGGIMISYKLK